MEKYTDHNFAAKIRKQISVDNMKEIVILIAIQLGMFLMAAYKGVGSHSFPVVMMMIVFTIISYALVLYFDADKILLIIVLILLNLGFLVQMIHAGENFGIKRFLIKLLIALVATGIVAVLYYFLSGWLSKDIIVLAMMIFQMSISVLMVVIGKNVGKKSEGGATISLAGITPFEIVKILYIFILVGLLCKENTERSSFLGVKIDREVLLCLYTIVLSPCFVLCSELGTLLVIYFSGLTMLWIFGSHRKGILTIVILSFVGFAVIWMLSSMVLLPIIKENPHLLPSVVAKPIKRFAFALHPENDSLGMGYQGTLSLQAIAMGGWFGIGTEKYRISIPEASCDVIFANVIQTCGIFMGFLLILSLFAFLKRGMTIAELSEDLYQKGMATGITVVIIVEAIIHIGYNLAIFPITGIPLYFVSLGFTALVTGITLITILLVISVYNVKGKES